MKCAQAHISWRFIRLAFVVHNCLLSRESNFLTRGGIIQGRIMGFIGGTAGYRLLKRIAPNAGGGKFGDEPSPSARLTHAFGRNILDEFSGRTVADFGCGSGSVAVSIARQVPDARVVGIDIQQRHLDKARRRAAAAGVGARCSFMTRLREPVDVILSFDAFEHFADPGGVLQTMYEHLRPGGAGLAAFGPTWLHPRGGHLFSIFPWAHLLFTEAALIRWRADFKSDGASRFGEVEGGLNRMRIERFERLIENSPLKLDWLRLIPIRGIELLKCRPFREFGTALVTCRLSRAVGMESELGKKRAA